MLFCFLCTCYSGLVSIELVVERLLKICFMRANWNKRINENVSTWHIVSAFQRWVLSRSVSIARYSLWCRILTNPQKFQPRHLHVCGGRLPLKTRSSLSWLRGWKALGGSRAALLAWLMGTSFGRRVAWFELDCQRKSGQNDAELQCLFKLLHSATEISCFHIRKMQGEMILLCKEATWSTSVFFRTVQGHSKPCMLALLAVFHPWMKPLRGRSHGALRRARRRLGTWWCLPYIIKEQCWVEAAATRSDRLRVFRVSAFQIFSFLVKVCTAHILMRLLCDSVASRTLPCLPMTSCWPFEPFLFNDHKIS